jgi:hypothetical protein
LGTVNVRSNPATAARIGRARSVASISATFSAPSCADRSTGRRETRAAMRSSAGLNVRYGPAQRLPSENGVTATVELPYRNKLIGGEPGGGKSGCS